MEIVTAVISAVILLSVAYLVYNYFAMLKISVSNYTVRDSRIKSKIRIAQLTDLHLKEYGEFNGGLSDKIKEQNPDVVVVTGDMCRRGYKDYAPVTQLLEEAAKTAPVYYALGNHELDYLKDYGDEILKEIEKTGAVILDNETAEIEVKGTRLEFLGLTRFKKFNDEDVSEPEIQKQIQLINDFSAGENYKILICHYPEYAPKYFSGSYKKYIKCGFDLMLSGHAHGGLVRLPFIGGVIAPKQGLFPKYDKGIYEFEGFKLVVSAGFGDAGYFFRINNPPEIVTVDLTPDSDK